VKERREKLGKLGAMPRKGYRQSAEHRARISRSVSAAISGHRHSEETKQRIGAGVRRAARARSWWNDPPSERDYILGAVFSRLSYWSLEGTLPELAAVRRETFEQMTRTAQQRFLNQVVVRITRPPAGAEKLTVSHADGSRRRIQHQLEIEFADGSHWPTRPTGAADPNAPPFPEKADGHPQRR